MMLKHAKKLSCLALLLGASSCGHVKVSPADHTQYRGVAQGPATFSLRFHQSERVVEETVSVMLQPGDQKIEVGQRGEETVFLTAGPGTFHHDVPFKFSPDPACWRQPVLGSEKGSFRVYEHGSWAINLVVGEPLPIDVHLDSE